LKNRPLLVATLLGAAFFLVSWFLWTDSRHFIDGGDVFFPLDQILLLSKVERLWYPDQLGALAYNVSVLPLRSVFALLQWCGFSGIAIQRLFLAAGYAFSAAGMYLFARKFWQDGAAPIIAAIWYPCGISYCLAVPNENNVVALALLPWLLYTALCALDDVLYVIPFALLSVFFGFIVANPPTVVLVAGIVAVVWFLGAYGKASLKRLGIVGGLLLFGALSTNLWWVFIAKTALASNKIVAAGVTDLSWALRRSTLVSIIEQSSFWGFGFGANPWYTIGRWYLENPLPHTALVLTPILAFGVLYFRPETTLQRFRINALIVIAVVAMFLAKGEHDPFAGASAWIYANVPGMFLFREPVKFLFVPALVLPLLAAVAYDELSLRLPRAAAYCVAALFLGVPIMTGWALLSGWAFSFAESQARTAIPSYWYQAANFLNDNDTRHDRVLLLPEDGFYQAHYTWGLQGVDRIAETSVYAPIVRLVSHEYAYLQNPYGERALRTLKNALRSQRADWVRNEFDRLSISYVVLRGDIAPDGRAMSLAEALYDLRAIGAQRVAQFGPLKIYHLDSRDRVESPRQVIRSCASPSGEVQLAMRLPSVVSIIRSSTPECKRNPMSLQIVRHGVAAPAGAVVLRSRSVDQRKTELPSAVLAKVPSRRRMAITDERRFLRPNNGASFCPQWHFAFRDSGWNGTRCIDVGNAEYIAFESSRYDAKHSPVSLQFRWLPNGEPVSVPLGTSLRVPEGTRSAELTVMPWPNPIPLQAVREAANAISLDAVVADLNVPETSAPYIRIERQLSQGLCLDGMTQAAELVYRLPSGERLSAFVSSNSSMPLDVVAPFESSFQSIERSSPRPALLLKDVVLEGISFPFTRSTKLLTGITLSQADADSWSLTILKHRQTISPSSGDDVYVGSIVKTPAAATSFRTGPWWNNVDVRADRSGWIGMREAYSDYWQLTGASTHAVLDGYANAWFVPRPGRHSATIALVYIQRAFYATSIVAFAVLIGAVLLLRRRINETS
jgi:Alpha-(1->3)-arabinofuranosyltransferase